MNARQIPMILQEINVLILLKNGTKPGMLFGTSDSKYWLHNYDAQPFQNAGNNGAREVIWSSRVKDLLAPWGVAE